MRRRRVTRACELTGAVIDNFTAAPITSKNQSEGDMNGGGGGGGGGGGSEFQDQAWQP